jgi:hypothetical protein
MTLIYYITEVRKHLGLDTDSPDKLNLQSTQACNVFPLHATASVGENCGWETGIAWCHNKVSEAREMKLFF